MLFLPLRMCIYRNSHNQQQSNFLHSYFLSKVYRYERWLSSFLSIYQYIISFMLTAMQTDNEIFANSAHPTKKLSYICATWTNPEAFTSGFNHFKAFILFVVLISFRPWTARIIFEIGRMRCCVIICVYWPDIGVRCRLGVLYNGGEVRPHFTLRNHSLYGVIHPFGRIFVFLQ